MLLNHLLRSEQEFRGSMLFPYSRHRTSQIKIKTQNHELKLKADALGFQLVIPSSKAPPTRADRVFGNLIFFQLARAKMKIFLAEERAKKIIDNSPHSIVVTTSSPDGPDYQVRLGGQCPDDSSLTVALRESPDIIAGCVTQTIMAALRSKPEQLASQTAFALRSDEIDHVIIREGIDILDIIRDDAGFRSLSAKKSTISTEAGKQLLKALAEEKLELSPSSSSTHLRKVGTIVARGQAPSTVAKKDSSSSASSREHELTIELYDDLSQEGQRVVKRNDDLVLLRVPPALRWAFSADGAWARNRSLSQWTAQDIESVTIESTDKTEQNLIIKNDDFYLGSRNGARADRALAHRLLDELSHLEALRFLAPPIERPAQGLVQVSWRWVEKDQSEPHSESLWLGRRTRGGVLAWSTLSPGTFVLPAFSAELFTTPLVDCSPMRLDPKALLELNLRTDDAAYQFSRRGSSLQARGEQAVQDMVDPLTGALAGLDILSATPKSSSTALRDSRGRPSTQILAERSRPFLTIKARSSTRDSSEENFTLHYSGSTIWQGQSVVIGWREGLSYNYFITRSSINELLKLL